MECPVNTTGLFINLSSPQNMYKSLSFGDVRFLKTIYTVSTLNYVNIETVEISHTVLKNSLIDTCR